jgi:hypothetical protein
MRLLCSWTSCPAGRHRLGWDCRWSIDRRGLSRREGGMRRTTTQSLGVSNPLSFFLSFNLPSCLAVVRSLCCTHCSWNHKRCSSFYLQNILKFWDLAILDHNPVHIDRLPYGIICALLCHSDIPPPFYFYLSLDTLLSWLVTGWVTGS